MRRDPPLLRYGAGLPIDRTPAGGAAGYPVVPPGLLRFAGRSPQLKLRAIVECSCGTWFWLKPKSKPQPKPNHDLAWPRDRPGRAWLGLARPGMKRMCGAIRWPCRRGGAFGRSGRRVADRDGRVARSTLGFIAPGQGRSNQVIPSQTTFCPMKRERPGQILGIYTIYTFYRFYRKIIKRFQSPPSLAIDSKLANDFRNRWRPGLSLIIGIQPRPRVETRPTTGRLQGRPSPKFRPTLG